MSDYRFDRPGPGGPAPAPAPAPPTPPAPPARRERSTGWIKAVTIVGAAVLGLGAIIAVAGVAASGDDSDVEEAEAALPGATEDRDAAVQERDAAEAALADAQAVADEATARGGVALDASNDLCDCDQRISGIFDDLSAAFAANDLAAGNAVGTELNAEVDAANAALSELQATGSGSVPGQPVGSGD